MNGTCRSAITAALIALTVGVDVHAEKIVFTTDRDLNDEIYSMDTDGSNQTNLTNLSGNDQQPSWSPGAGKITFATNRDGDFEIYVMDPDGSNPTRLTTDPGTDQHPCYSPDGSKIAFESTRAGDRNIFVMDADGSNVVQLTTDPNWDDYPVWSPDGSKIAWHSFRDGDWEIYVMDADGSNKTNLTNDPGSDQFPAWSPDGTQIAFASLRGGDGDVEIYKMDSDGSNPTALTTNTLQDGAPWWSADGSKIIFCTIGNTNDEVYSMDPDGSNQTNLTNATGGDTFGRWSWGAPVNYRSIGTDAGVLHNTGTASLPSGTKTMTFSVALPSNVGPGDRIDIQGSMSITQEESQAGSGSTSPFAAPAIQGGTSQAYVLLIATRNNADVTNVTGGTGLTWTQQVEQCSGNSNTRTEIWTATGYSGGSFTPIVTFSPNDTIAVVLNRYSGVGGFEDAHGENTNGPSGACAGGTDDKTALITLTSTANGSVHLIGANPQRNSLSNPTAGYSLINSAVGGSGQGQQRLAAYGRTVSPAAADPFQVSINKSTDWAMAGIVLNPASGTSTYHVQSRDSDTQITTHDSAGANHTNETFSITRAYNTLQAWEDDRQGDLVGEGRREVGVCYNDGAFTNQLVISGSITDAENYMTLTVAEGQRHTGMYNSGAQIDAMGGWTDGDAITVQDEYTRIEWLEIKAIQDKGDAVFFDDSPAGDNGLVSNIYVHSCWQDYPNAGVRVEGSGITVRNSFFTGGTSNAVWVESGSVVIENCTMWGSPTSGYGIRAHNGDVSVTNTISVGHDTGMDIYIETAGFATITTFGYNMFERWGGGFDPDDYSGNVLPPADLEDLFVSISAPVDLHLHPTGHVAIDSGTDLSSSFTNDIDNQGRAVWDMGADEVAANYRSIGTNAAPLYSTGTASIEKGSTTVTFGGGASLPTNVGMGDALIIGADTYYMVARNSATQATVHTGSSNAHVGDTFTIARAYNSLQAWEDAVDGDLVGGYRREVGVCYADGSFTAGLLIAGSTTSADYFLRLTSAPSAYHQGLAGGGAVVDFGGAFDGIDVNNSYTQIDRLELTDTTGIAVYVYGSLSGVLLTNLLVSDATSINGSIRFGSGGTLRNTIIYDGNIALNLENTGDVMVENVTIYNSINEGLLKSAGAGLVSVRNTISVGNTGSDFSIPDLDLTWFGNNMYSGVSGFNPGDYQGGNTAPPSDLENLFVSTVSLSEDLHLEPNGHQAGNTGLDLSTDFLADIDDIARSGSWDQGADEGVSDPGGTPRIISWGEYEP